MDNLWKPKKMLKKSGIGKIWLILTSFGRLSSWRCMHFYEECALYGLIVRTKTNRIEEKESHQNSSRLPSVYLTINHSFMSLMCMVSTKQFSSNFVIIIFFFITKQHTGHRRKWAFIAALKIEIPFHWNRNAIIINFHFSTRFNFLLLSTSTISPFFW